MQVTEEQFDVAVENPRLILREYPRGCEASHALLNYRLTVQQDLPARLKHLYSWNLNSWKTPDRPIRDPKTCRCRRLLKTGPLCLQEIKWDQGVPEKLAGYLPGTKIFSTSATLLDSGKWSGGTGILLPPGWQADTVHELVPSKALAVLVRDRTTSFYLISVYLHPVSKKQDIEKLMQAWSRLDKVTTRAIFVGDFNRIDESNQAQWENFLSLTGSLDVDPKLLTYYSQTSASPLDRCLKPTDWITSASWNPAIGTIYPTSNTGHKILHIVMQLKPSVVDNPRDPKHEVLPSDLFMPGKYPTAAKHADFQELLRLLNREIQQSFSCASLFHSLPFVADNPEGKPARCFLGAVVQVHFTTRLSVLLLLGMVAYAGSAKG